ncbi:biopolymer transporter ExbD [Luteolibacter sp. SL250]|uniref:ExbD/TolR family protein n=1 Tax=Luteolibacter sp. SL250 TaxID=2995170 RepID=UPI0022713ED9|nr:biopolymer transporter ExbD [Luteolibacter sp. SL250]WAC19773.1 biopolymer transporter ExbD [Luteolibacter sp. SL250]
MKSRIRRRFPRKESQLGFQIAPMIDVVFVILLFFMVAAGNARMENALNTQLPGGATEINLPDDVVIRIAEDGQVYLNDEPQDHPERKDLKELADGVLQLKQASDSAGTSLLVTIEAEEQAKYERVVDVLDALTRAKVRDVTFMAGAFE